MIKTNSRGRPVFIQMRPKHNGACIGLKSFTAHTTFTLKKMSLVCKDDLNDINDCKNASKNVEDVVSDAGESQEHCGVDLEEKNETEEATGSTEPNEIELKIVWNKKVFPVSFDVEKTIEELKEAIKELTGIPVNMQKLMHKGLIKDHSVTLREAKISKGSKLMVVGSTLKDVLTVTPPSQEAAKASKASDDVSGKKEPLCNQKMHKKILEKEKPDDIMPGLKGVKERLPAYPLSGMYNKRGGKVRLTFKLELDQVWLGTKERTEKLPMSSIRNIISEPIEGNEEYHIMALQLGPTEASRYWIYWVPAQYIDAIKDTVLGSWQTF